MTYQTWIRNAALLASISTYLVAPRAGDAQTIYGTLSNFDVFNDTGKEAHGFEIELDGITSKDISFKFASPYIRYGTPVVVDFPGGVYVRYESRYDPARGVFTETTPVPARMDATAGHECWTGGAPGYETSGCEHFGLGLNATPTATHYRWLLADPSNAGGLKANGSEVSIAAPLWSAAAGAVQAVLTPSKSGAALYGTAVWVKTYESEPAERASLEHLLTDDALVPQSAGQMEVEWELLQSNPKKAGGGELQHGKSPKTGSQSVVRRYEFYEYTGPYDPESHEAICGGASSSGGGSGKGGNGGGGGSCSTPGAGDIGRYLGAQMAAAQLSPALPNAPAITAVLNTASGGTSVQSGNWVSIYGTNLAGTARGWKDSDFSGLQLPTSLDGVQVQVNGHGAALSYISPAQINAQIPNDTATGLVPIVVKSGSGTASSLVNLQPYAPGFFAMGKYAAAVHSDGVPVAPAGYLGNGVVSRPAQPGETILIFGSGFGPTAAPVAAGQIVQSPAALADLSQLRITIGGTAAVVTYGGVVGAGVYQLNVVVPAAADGDQAVSASIAGFASPGSSIAVKN